MYLLSKKKKQSESEQSPKQKEKLDQTHQLVELLSKFIHFVVKIGVPGIILPRAFESYYKYFANGNDAFELAVPSR